MYEHSTVRVRYMEKIGDHQLIQAKIGTSAVRTLGSNVHLHS